MIWSEELLTDITPPTLLYEGLSTEKTSFFTMNDKVYIMDGTNYLVYDGEEVKEVEPYVPKLFISKEPSGGGTVLEDFNLLGTGFKDSFSSDGSATEYQLSLKVLDETKVEIEVDGKDLEEDTDFTVDRIEGKVTFNTAPAKGTNNVIITAHKTFQSEMLDYFDGDGKKTEFELSRKELDDDPITISFDSGTTFDKVEDTDFTVDREKGVITFTTAPASGTNNIVVKSHKSENDFPNRIKKCRFHAIYGGANDTRVFVSGNPDMPEYVWRLGLYDPTYAPENGFYKYPERVTGFSRQYDYLVIHRENGLHQVNFEIIAGIPSFPSKPINDQVGTLTPHSIQIIENDPVFLSENGVYELIATTLRDERNVQHISEAVDSRLLREPNLQDAVTVEHDKKYWLAVNGNVYVLDYRLRSAENPIGEWFFFDNIHANTFLEVDGQLYFGSSEEGLMYRYMKDTDPRPYHDDGQPIKAHWKSKYLTFDADELMKYVEKVYYSLKPYTRTSVDLFYVTNKKSSNLVKNTRMDLLDFWNIDFDHFSFMTNIFPQESMAKIKAKKITHFQLVLKNENLNEALGILSVGIKYRYQTYVK
jgi:hypothetical protein